MQLAINDIITRALPDSRELVRDKVMFSLPDMLSTCAHMERSWLVHLVTLYEQCLCGCGHDRQSVILRVFWGARHS